MTVAELEAQGLRCCNSARSTLLTMDRGVVQQRLADAGLPVPNATTVSDADQARAWAAGHPVAVKVSRSDVGEGNGVARWDDPDTMQPPAAPGPYLVRHWVPSAGVDRKLAAIRTKVGGLLKPWSPARRRPGSVFDPSAQLRGSRSPSVGHCSYRSMVSTSSKASTAPWWSTSTRFPSCNGLPGAATAIADTLLTYAAAGT